MNNTHSIQVYHHHMQLCIFLSFLSQSFILSGIASNPIFGKTNYFNNYFTSFYFLQPSYISSRSFFASLSSLFLSLSTQYLQLFQYIIHYSVIHNFLGNEWWLKEVGILLLQLSATTSSYCFISIGENLIMEWNLKASSWDLSGIEEATTLPNIETMEESNRFGVYKSKGEFSVDLKLGQVGNSATESSSSVPLPLSKDVSASVSKIASPSSSSGSFKRARAVNNTTLTVSCLVDGCNSDLSNCRDYHRRHKVCELHSKTPEVSIGGLKQRFCQQCSRFHSLDQFDERKRSCRKRLDGHNRRRRKPQPEPITRPTGSFLSNYQGTQLLPFSSSTAMVNSGWSNGLISSGESGMLHIHNQHQQVPVIDKQDLFLGSTATSYGEGKQLQFLHTDNNIPSLHNQNSPLLRTSNKMFCDSLTNSSVNESPCALSLLSSSQTHTPENGLNQMVQQQQQPHSMSLMQPLGLSLHGNNNSFESMDRVLVPNGSESDHCSSLYNLASDGSQGNEAPQLFPYQWE